jgi:hypothetical protein
MGQARGAPERQWQDERWCEVSIYKRGEVYWYKFVWQGRMVRESSKQGNDKVARRMEASHRTSLAKGEVGIREKKRTPTLSDFAEKQFLPWAESAFSAKPKNLALLPQRSTAFEGIHAAGLASVG